MKSPATRIYQRRSYLVMASYFVIFSATDYFVVRVHPEGWKLYVCAVLPFLPLLVVFMLTAAYLKAECDDFKRDLMMRCLLWGAGASMSLNLFAGFLRIFGWHGQLFPFSELFAFCLAVLAAKITYRVSNRLPAE
jgi:hypothetical protein